MHQPRVVVTGDDHHRAIGPERVTDRAQRLHRGRCRRPCGPHGTLERVAQQHQAVDAVDRLQESRQGIRPAQHVDAAAQPEVQVGDDQRAHGGAR